MKFNTLTAVTVFAATIAWSSAAKADSFNIYVGYADNLRASGFFPTPFVGSTFNGQPVVSQTNLATAGTFDSGAVRIDNTGGTALAISNFQVSFNNGAVVYAIWGAGLDLTVAPGQTGIFTQTSSSENFDSSDQGLFGGNPPNNLAPNNYLGNGNTNLIGGCSSSPTLFTASEAANQCNVINAPIISFSENGNKVSFVDTGFILNTGEYDFVNNSAYGEDGNESINWNSLGGTTRGGSTTPEPGTIFLLGTGLVSVSLLKFRARGRK